jgi:flagellar motor switch protein FliM
MSIEEFLHLSPGDTIELNQKINAPLVIKVENNPKFYGQPGKVKKKMAVQILDFVKEDEDQW